MPVPTIEWTREKLKAFKKLCAEAKEGEVFKFEGHDILKEYGDYLIEYLEGQFNG